MGKVKATENGGCTGTVCICTKQLSPASRPTQALFNPPFATGTTVVHPTSTSVTRPLVPLGHWLRWLSSVVLPGPAFLRALDGAAVGRLVVAWIISHPYW